MATSEYATCTVGATAVAGVLWLLQDQGFFATLFESILGMVGAPLFDMGAPLPWPVIM